MFVINREREHSQFFALQKKTLKCCMNDSRKELLKTSCFINSLRCTSKMLFPTT